MNLGRPARVWSEKPLSRAPFPAAATHAHPGACLPDRRVPTQSNLHKRNRLKQ